MRIPKAAWVQALKALCGNESELRFNESVGRWEFILPSADGVPRSQFWGWFYNPRTGKRIEPEPETGMVPFRDLDDDAMAEALRNLERTFIGNPYDGAGTTRREMERRIRHNRDHLRRKYTQAGEAFADMAAERGRRLRGAPLVQVATDLTPTPRGA